MEPEKVNDAEQMVNEYGGDDQSVDGGDNQGTSVTDETVKTVPLDTFKTVEGKLKAEKAAREEAERIANEVVKQANEYMKRSQPQEDRDEYDAVTYGELQKILADKDSRYAHDMQLRFINESANRAVSKHGLETYNKCLDMFKNISEGQRNAILNSQDPGEEMVQYITNRFGFGKADRAKEMADQISQNTNQVQTLSSVSKTESKNMDKLRELEKLSPQEIGRRLDELARKKGG